jgi:hypothetical protein
VSGRADAEKLPGGVINDLLCQLGVDGEDKGSGDERPPNTQEILASAVLKAALAQESPGETA